MIFKKCIYSFWKILNFGLLVLLWFSEFFRCVLCSHLAIFKLRSYWQERLCTYTGASCSNRPGTHRRILLLFFLSDLSPRALLKKGLRDLSLTSILAMCVYTSIACQKVSRLTLPCLPKLPWCIHTWPCLLYKIISNFWLFQLQRKWEASDPGLHQSDHFQKNKPGLSPGLTKELHHNF